jgi:hypothetical protein
MSPADKFFSYTSIADMTLIYEEDSGLYRKEIKGLKTAWFKDAECKICHREGKPAVIYADGDSSWYFNNKRHRDDGPAVEWYNCTGSDKTNIKWYKHGSPYEPTAHEVMIWKHNKSLEKQNAQNKSSSTADQSCSPQEGLSIPG